MEAQAASAADGWEFGIIGGRPTCSAPSTSPARASGCRSWIRPSSRACRADRSRRRVPPVAADRYDLHMAHPLRTRAIAAARVKTDAIDAKTLAHVLRAGLLPTARSARRVKRQPGAERFPARRPTPLDPAVLARQPSTQAGDRAPNPAYQSPTPASPPARQLPTRPLTSPGPSWMTSDRCEPSANITNESPLRGGGSS
jgi:hypothetical protein